VLHIVCYISVFTQYSVGMIYRGVEENTRAWARRPEVDALQHRHCVCCGRRHPAWKVCEYIDYFLLAIVSSKHLSLLQACFGRRDCGPWQLCPLAYYIQFLIHSFFPRSQRQCRGGKIQMLRGFDSKPRAKPATHLRDTARKSILYAQFVQFNLITNN
jgi:hypothetical protein